MRLFIWRKKVGEKVSCKDCINSLFCIRQTFSRCDLFSMQDAADSQVDGHSGSPTCRDGSQFPEPSRRSNLAINASAGTGLLRL